MLTNNREALFQKLIAGLDELMRDNGIEVIVDINSCAAGFQGLAGHILSLIQSLEEDGSTPREILDKIKTILDDGSPSIIQ